ncbi:hotdog family protein [Rahnella perminowiae]|jgi:predicted hotdog family 3-hydroxylacyl-ACP dehydratase|uniref:Hotdog family protein n=1 Tax=Rahnella perminowiae TaxID=2816244 RepID=A0ABS6KY83_9GAMM|nr:MULTISPECIES: hotdog family protein [Rahnella]UJD88162.1 3-hydroxy-fatty acyl-ACP dehydratase [Rahnella aquatilis]MBU9812183.1 hotdog family protein [Rahnella perminowiae]MBU9826051.1 hotdog family protein [Rahnella perminowiae]MBU9834532.1 hotdog family protein [Rahnella perminowiae]MCR9002787.1 hotdog family protein [Rahnella perminowiae]
MSMLSAGQYLPHESPMVLLDKVISVTAETALCSVVVSENSVLAPFLNERGALPAWYAIELIAQTVGVWSGWHGAQSGEPPQVGMLLGGRALKTSVPEFAAGSELFISVLMVLCDEKLASFEGVICIKQEKDNLQVAKGRLNTYQPDKDELIKLIQGKQE